MAPSTFSVAIDEELRRQAGQGFFEEKTGFTDEAYFELTTDTTPATKVHLPRLTVTYLNVPNRKQGVGFPPNLRPIDFDIFGQKFCNIATQIGWHGTIVFEYLKEQPDGAGQLIATSDEPLAEIPHREQKELHGLWPYYNGLGFKYNLGDKGTATERMLEYQISRHMETGLLSVSIVEKDIGSLLTHTGTLSSLEATAETLRRELSKK